MLGIEQILKWNSRKAVAIGIGVAALAGVFGPVTALASIIGISTITTVGIIAFAVIDYQKEKNKIYDSNTKADLKVLNPPEEEED